MLKSMIAAGALVSSVVVAPTAGVTQHDATQHRDTPTQTGWITLYSLPFYRGFVEHVEPYPFCYELPIPVGSAVNDSTQTVAFYPQTDCYGLPTIVGPGGKVPEFPERPVSFDSLPLPATPPGQ